MKKKILTAEEKAAKAAAKDQEYCKYLETKEQELLATLTAAKKQEYCEYLKTKEKNNERKEQIVVAFQVGTLSKYAPKKKGTLTYLGEYNFKDIQNLRADEIFYKEKDGKTIITDEMGNIVSDDDINGDVGVLNFDEEYDTTYCKYLEDCSDIEIEIINKRESYF